MRAQLIVLLFTILDWLRKGPPNPCKSVGPPSSDSYYVYIFTRERYIYERTCGTLEAAVERVRKLRRPERGQSAIWVKNTIIKDAFY